MGAEQTRARSEPGLASLCRSHRPTGGLRAFLSQGQKCWLETVAWTWGALKQESLWD